MSLLSDLMRKLAEVARAHPDCALTRVRVRLGAWSHMSPEHFEEHFRELAAGTAAEKARLDVILGEEDDPLAQQVLLESVELAEL